MKAIQLPGAPGWAIDMEFSPWDARKHVLRTQGDTGTTIFFATEVDANEHIAPLLKRGEQGALLKYAPPKPPPPEPVAPPAEPEKPKRGRPAGGK
jgi:hypothetical protein